MSKIENECLKIEENITLEVKLNNGINEINNEGFTITTTAPKVTNVNKPYDLDKKKHQSYNDF